MSAVILRPVVLRTSPPAFAWLRLRRPPSAVNLTPSPSSNVRSASTADRTEAATSGRLTISATPPFPINSHAGSISNTLATFYNVVEGKVRPPSS